MATFLALDNAKLVVAKKPAYTEETKITA